MYTLGLFFLLVEIIWFFSAVVRKPSTSDPHPSLNKTGTLIFAAVLGALSVVYGIYRELSIPHLVMVFQYPLHEMLNEAVLFVAGLLLNPFLTVGLSIMVVMLKNCWLARCLAKESALAVPQIVKVAAHYDIEGDENHLLYYTYLQGYAGLMRITGEELAEFQHLLQKGQTSEISRRYAVKYLPSDPGVHRLAPVNTLSLVAREWYLTLVQEEKQKNG